MLWLRAWKSSDHCQEKDPDGWANALFGVLAHKFDSDVVEGLRCHVIRRAPQRFPVDRGEDPLEVVGASEIGRAAQLEHLIVLESAVEPAQGPESITVRQAFGIRVACQPKCKKTRNPPTHMRPPPCARR